MAHPSKIIPKITYLIDEDDKAAVLASGKYFYAITCIEEGTSTKVEVKGGGVFAHDGSVFSETDSSSEVSIPMVKGVTIYGRFSSVRTISTASNGKFLAYV